MTVTRIGSDGSCEVISSMGATMGRGKEQVPPREMVEPRRLQVHIVECGNKHLVTVWRADGELRSAEGEFPIRVTECDTREQAEEHALSTVVRIAAIYGRRARHISHTYHYELERAGDDQPS